MKEGIMRNIASPEFVDDPHPRKLSKRGWTLLGITAVGVIAIYTLVVAFYSTEGRSAFTAINDPPAQGISVVMEPIAISPDQSLSAFRFTLASNDPAIEDANGRANDNIRVTISGPDGSQEIRISEGTAFGRAEVSLGISGELAEYPFDTYSAVYFVAADFYDKETGGINQSRESIPVTVTTRSAVNGWDSAMNVEYTPAPAAVVSVELERAFSTKLFALLLVALSFVVAALALFISLLVFSNRRKIEVALLAWSGSLLFALPILRNYLPGAPPIGAAIDIYVFLWAIVMSFLAVFFIVAAWVSQTAARLRLDEQKKPVKDGQSHGA
jgi:hypothetical protein